MLTIQKRTIERDRGTHGGRSPSHLACAIALSAAVGIAISACTFSGAATVQPRSVPTAVTAPTVAPPTSTVPSTAPSTHPAPVRVRIPAIGVDAPLMRLGLLADGSLEVPPDAARAGWFTGAPVPGRIGPAIIVGHVLWKGTEGVFADLSRLHLGSRIVVTRRDGTAVTFAVTRVSRFAKARFPTELVYGNINHAGLRLITCDRLDPVSKKYIDNLVVFATLAATS